MAARLLCLALAAFSASAFHLPDQAPLLLPQAPPSLSSAGRKLRGRFLHITDIHPDPFYRVHANTDAASACHRNNGAAGFYGAETSDCDSPLSLVEHTFKWIDKHLKDEVDFVIWTGDSARHDNDERHPRNQSSVVSQNKYLVGMMQKVFGREDHTDPEKGAFSVPIVPTFGNNDILPHNIFQAGPNKWTKKYAHLWRDFIPEAQRHQFTRGGWFYVEVIPDKLAVFSLNTLYFFASNAAVDGCASSKEPGYEHFEWLRIQLQFLRDRGMKALLIGHVPPARNDAKSNWEETCWQKYAIWMEQYRDVIVGSMYGHMNIEHFILQDFHDIKYDIAAGDAKLQEKSDISTQGATDYLTELRRGWSELPDILTSNKKKGDGKKKPDGIGGEFAERFAVSFVSASVVPNYFPTLRVFEYNLTGLEHVDIYDGPARGPDDAGVLLPPAWEDSDSHDDQGSVLSRLFDALKKKSNKKKKKRKGDKKKPKFTVPLPPSKASLPGPAYFPQSLSLVGVRQYYANLTYINNDFIPPDASETSTIVTRENSPAETTASETWPPNEDDTDNFVNMTRWREGKHHGKNPKSATAKPNPFRFEVEYDTRHPKDVYGMHDDNGLVVRKWVELAARIGKYKPQIQDVLGEDDEVSERKKRKKEGKKKRKIINRTWYAFVDRATVATLDDDELHDEFGDAV